MKTLVKLILQGAKAWIVKKLLPELGKATISYLTNKELVAAATNAVITVATVTNDKDERRELALNEIKVQAKSLGLSLGKQAAANLLENVLAKLKEGK